VTDEHGRLMAWEWRDRALAAEDERDRLRSELERERASRAVIDGAYRDVLAERDRLRAVVADITAHATPIGEDDDGFVAVGYTVTVGAIHRALAAVQGATDDPLHPVMPTGEDQVFHNWLDFVERVARPIVEAENDDGAEQAAMALYRKASPFFVCAALVMASNERDRLRAAVERAHDHVGLDEHVLRTLDVDDLVALIGVLRQDCRDLRADIKVQTDAADAAAVAVGNMAEYASRAVEERDRLRGVVERFVSFARSIGTTPTNSAVDSMTGLLADALAALDVSPAMGGDDA
jgi:hypothetical protein